METYIKFLYFHSFTDIVTKFVHEVKILENGRREPKSSISIFFSNNLPRCLSCIFIQSFFFDIQSCDTQFKVIMVFDVTSRDSFSDLGRWLTEAQTLFSKPVSVLVCGNKIDVIGKRAVSEVEARNWAASRNYMYAETSASMATNVDESLNALIQVVVDQAAMTKQAQLLEREKEARIKQIKQEITVIAGLPPAQREKKFKLLKAQYHPDRNQDNEALATFIFQYIQSEYERFQSAA
eukprot:TRINITY_DN8405_c0_g1_i3.p1 TRINITY_DN8405_c0_g1~~TRINITY_DN8405_c0_g1_i3.p1  ORF type:complete len:237 (+),score=31.38 TRINITY_DN8405_c0_g1_i3:170-880(+)